MSANKELSARIFNIQKYSIYDGDGIRTLIFFKG
ncbi:choline TMA-lyase-activating enzyme, partial [Escherichia coli]|nr:choline TMA-lyase-activating enzyme [Escherichia coli]